VFCLWRWISHEHRWGKRPGCKRVVVKGLKPAAPSGLLLDSVDPVITFVALMHVLADVRAEADTLVCELFHGLNLAGTGFEMAVDVHAVVVELHVERVGGYGEA
jgi:hypothetical protein